MQTQHPTTIIVFGGTGDLVAQKIMPALYTLYDMEVLDTACTIIGISRKTMSDEVYQAWVREALEKKGHTNTSDFLQCVTYLAGDATDVTIYKDIIEHATQKTNTTTIVGNIVFFLALAPAMYAEVFTHIATLKQQHDKTSGWFRLLIEKPFGRDGVHAKQLDTLLRMHFDDTSIFKIDHYTAKESVQNIFTFRFANTLFEHVWNAQVIERVDITLHEAFDIKQRGALYDGIGQLKDMGQNHALQLLAMIAMEQPQSIKTVDVQRARYDVLRHVRVIPETLRRAQYKGYLETPGVAPVSMTETFFSATLAVDTERWRGVPFHMQNGKALHETGTSIRVTFKPRVDTSFALFATEMHKTVLTIVIQPNPSIKLSLVTKDPGIDMVHAEQDMSYMYPTTITKTFDAYERLLFDVLRGDQTLFISTDEVYEQWRITESIIEQWQHTPLHTYDKGVHPDTIGDTM